MFGIFVAEHVHDIKNTRDARRKDITDKILQTVDAIADGEMTLVDTPEEVCGGMKGLPENLRAMLPGMLRDARNEQRTIAQALRDYMTESPEIGKQTDE